MNGFVPAADAASTPVEPTSGRDDTSVLFGIARDLNGRAHAIRHVSEALWTLGMNRPAEGLASIADGLEDASVEIRAWWGGYVSRQHDETMRSVGETLCAALKATTGTATGAEPQRGSAKQGASEQ